MWYFAFAFSDCQKPYVLEGWYQFRRLQQQQQQSDNRKHLQDALSITHSCSAGLFAGSCSEDAMQRSCTSAKLTQAVTLHDRVLRKLAVLWQA